MLMRPRTSHRNSDMQLAVMGSKDPHSIAMDVSFGSYMEVKMHGEPQGGLTRFASVMRNGIYRTW